MKRQAELSIEYVAIDAVIPHPRNVRVHTSAAQVAESLDVHGQYAPVIVQRSTGHVLAGNGLWARLAAAGAEQVAVTYVDVDDDQALRILLVDNETSDRAGYDEAALAKLLDEMGDLQGTGWTVSHADDLQALFAVPLTVEELSDKYGDEPDPDAFWPVARITLPPDLYEPWITFVAAKHEGVNHDALRALMAAGGLL